ncbi:hypothetical protein D3C83_144800 [compost metagenome]
MLVRVILELLLESDGLEGHAAADAAVPGQPNHADRALAQEGLDDVLPILLPLGLFLHLQVEYANP